MAPLTHHAPHKLAEDLRLPTSVREVTITHFAVFIIVLLSLFVLKYVIVVLARSIWRRKEAQARNSAQSNQASNNQNNPASMVTAPMPTAPVQRKEATGARRVEIEDALTHVTPGEIGAEGTCAICLEDLGGHARGIAQPDCAHAMHRSCLVSWLVKDPDVACPICRAPVLARGSRAGGGSADGGDTGTGARTRAGVDGLPEVHVPDVNAGGGGGEVAMSSVEVR